MENQYGRYRIKKQLGRGTMGVVYLAHDPQIDRLVALKVLRPDKVVSEEFVKRFLKEARAIGRLTHPNIVVVYDVGRDHGTIYIAMEYLEGRPFNAVIKVGKPDFATWASVGAQLAETLAYAHENGIVHRDIKPSNIIMTKDGRIKLTDFGIARVEDPEATLQTQVGDILGTPAYMSPEQVTGQAVDGRSDLFSLGVILYEWLLNQRPFTGKNMAAIFSAICNQPPHDPQEIDPTLPKPFSDLLLRCLQKIPADRFQDGYELVATIKASHNEILQTRKAIHPKRSNRLKWGLAALALSVASGYLAGPPAVRQVNVWLNPPPPREEAATSTPKPPAQIMEAPPTDTPAMPSAEPASEASQPKPPEIIQEALLKIASTPPGAEIRIDDAPRGKTPFDLSLPLGTYKVKIRLADYYEWEAAVRLGEIGEMPLHVQLIRRK